MLWAHVVLWPVLVVGVVLGDRLSALLTRQIRGEIRGVVAAPFSNWFQDHGSSPVHVLLVLAYLLPAAAVAWVAAVLTRRSDRGARPERATVGAGGRTD